MYFVRTQSPKTRERALQTKLRLFYYLCDYISKQGALVLLQDLLDWMSNCGFCTNGGWSPKISGKPQLRLANMRVVRASLMFIKVGNLIYDIFRLACTRFPKNAVAFKVQMRLFDLHLGENSKVKPYTCEKALCRIAHIEYKHSEFSASICICAQARSWDQHW